MGWLRGPLQTWPLLDTTWCQSATAQPYSSGARCLASPLFSSLNPLFKSGLHSPPPNVNERQHAHICLMHAWCRAQRHTLFCLTISSPPQTLNPLPSGLAFTQNHLVSVGDSACVFVWRMLRDDAQPAASASNIESNTSATTTTTTTATATAAAAAVGGWSAATGAGAPSVRSALLAPGMPAPKPTGGGISGTGFGVLQGPPGTVAGSGGMSVAGGGVDGVEAGPGVSLAAPAAVVAGVAAAGSATAAAAAPGTGAGSMWPPLRHSPGAAAGYALAATAPVPARAPGSPGGVPFYAGYAPAPGRVPAPGSLGGLRYHTRSIAAPAVAHMTAPSTTPPLAAPASPPTLGSSLGGWPAAAGQQPSTLVAPPTPAMGPRGPQPAEQCVALVGAPHASTCEGMVWRSDMGLFAYCVDSTLVVEDLGTRWVCMGSAARCRCT